MIQRNQGDLTSSYAFSDRDHVRLQQWQDYSNSLLQSKQVNEQLMTIKVKLMNDVDQVFNRVKQCSKE